MVYIFKNKTPSINDVVMVKITDINQLNVVGNLIDFNNLTGYISYSELCKKKRYNLHKIVNIGKEVIMQITGLNEEKNYVELSIRALIEKDIEEFTNYRKKYLAVYNLWRYVFMKLKPELEMKIERIDDDEINNFMENTLWKIEKLIEDDEQDDEINFEELHRNFINPKNNYELIKNITNYDIDKIKNILDSYSQIKIVPVKQTRYQEFTAYSHELNGLADIKNAMNYKSFDKYNDIYENYEISILYLASNKYSINVKQKNPMVEDINELYDYLIQEITKRCSSSNIVFTI
jgi:translation initiation factor 2 alpha subunit (eIF-2alpha)